MIAKVGIYIDNGLTTTKLDLFKDETISVTSTLQDISDISKTFIDYSQSFTIPASPTNKEVFIHWENNKLDDGFDARIRINGYITLNGVLYRSGLFQLEKATIKDNNPENYTITFFGNLLSLKDIFNGLLLKDLTALGLSFNYTGENVLNTLRQEPLTDNGIIGLVFPLVSSARNWNFGTGDNINTTAISYTELFPAIPIRNIFFMIESQFGIKFNGNFLNSPQINSAFLWCKNADKFVINTVPVDVFYQTSTEVFVPTDFPHSYLWEANAIRIAVSRACTVCNVKLTFSIKIPQIGISYTLQVYRNGVLWSSVNADNTYNINTFNTTTLFSITGQSLNGYRATWSVKVVSQQTFTFTSYFEIKENDSGTSIIRRLSLFQNTVQTNPGNVLSIASMMPEMKIEDFFTGVLKMWNLTCYGTSPTDFNIETVDDFYANAETYDLSKYVKTDTIEVNRIKWYKRIAFTFQKSTSYVQGLFWGVNGRGYGDLSESFDADGSEYKIELPFEKLLFENIGGISSLQVGKSLNNNLQPYIPKPVILTDLNNGNTVPIGGSIAYNYGIGSVNVSKIRSLGNEFILGTTYFSNCWGSESSVFPGNSINNSLYLTRYLNYLTNLFSKKARLVKLSAMLPNSLVQKIKLSNRIQIKDTRYLINSMTTDLTTLETKLELITDFRDAEEYGVVIFADAYRYLEYDLSPISGQNGWKTASGTSTRIITYGGYKSFLDYRGANAHCEFYINGSTTLPLQTLYRTFQNPRLDTTYYSFLFNPTTSSSTILNYPFRLFSLRENSTGTDYGNIFLTQSLVGTLYKWKIGISATSLTTPDVNSTTNFYSGRGISFASDNVLLIVLKHSEVTKKLTLYVFQNANGEYSSSLLPNIEPTTPECQLTLSPSIVPQVIAYTTFNNQMGGFLTGTRISSFFDIKF